MRIAYYLVIAFVALPITTAMDGSLFMATNGDAQLYNGIYSGDNEVNQYFVAKPIGNELLELQTINSDIAETGAGYIVPLIFIVIIGAVL